MEQIPISFDKSWHPYVQDLFETPEMKELKYRILAKEGTFYPKREDIFNVFKMPLDKIRVVIIGQDPYSSNNYANGYAFATNKDKKPFSLQIIEKEVGNLLRNDLKFWIEQGIFLLNTSLTVEKDKPGSHSKYWRNFISYIIATISREIIPVWLLWGNSAKDYKELIRVSETFKVVEIFEAAHPASEAKGRSGGFLGCNHFNKVNEYFELIGEKTINW